MCECAHLCAMFGGPFASFMRMCVFVFLALLAIRTALHAFLQLHVPHVPPDQPFPSPPRLSPCCGTFFLFCVVCCLSRVIVQRSLFLVHLVIFRYCARLSRLALVAVTCTLWFCGSFLAPSQATSPLFHDFCIHFFVSPESSSAHHGATCTCQSKCIYIYIFPPHCACLYVCVCVRAFARYLALVS